MAITTGSLRSNGLGTFKFLFLTGRGLDTLSFVKIQFLLFIFSTFLEKIYGGSYRLSFIISAGLCVAILPFISKSLIDFMRRVSWGVALITIYFIIHPLIIVALVLFGAREFPYDMSVIAALLSSSSWLINGILVLLVLNTWQKDHYESFLQLIWKVGFFIAVEAFLSFYLLRGTVFYDLSTACLQQEGNTRFCSVFVGSNYFSGFLGLMLYGLSFYFIFTRPRDWWFKLGVGFGALLCLASLERSVIAGFLLFNAIAFVVGFLRGLKKTRPEVQILKIFASLVVVIALGSAIVVGLARMREESLSSGASLFGRVMTWTRGAEVGAYFFPFGCGGNLGGLYNRATIVPNFLTTRLLNANSLSDKVLHAFSIAYYYATGAAGDKRASTHSTHVELFSEFGILGLLVALVFFIYPVWFLFRILPRLPASVAPEITAGALLAGLMCALQLPLFMISSGNLTCWLMGVFYIYIHKRFVPLVKRRDAALYPVAHTQLKGA